MRIALDAGVLFRTNETAFVQTKRKLLEECDLWCIVSLPAGVFAEHGLLGDFPSDDLSARWFEPPAARWEANRS